MAYSYYVTMTVQSGKVTGTVTDFVALINNTFAMWADVGNGGHVENIDGVRPADWAIFADVGLTTPLDFEITGYDNTSGLVTAWVATDVATSQVIYVAYGDVAVTTYQGDATTTWTSARGYEAVYHYNTLIGGTTWLDSTGHGFSMTNSGGSLADGLIGSSILVNGSSAYARVLSAPVTGVPLTISSWLNPDTMAAVPMSLLVYNGGWNGFYFGVGSGPNRVGMTTVENNFAVYDTAEKTGGATSTWFHVAGVSASVASRYMYINGAAGTQNTTSVTPSASPNSFTVGGASNNSTVDNFYDGYIDETRVHSAARDAAWLEAEYNSQVSATTFWGLGSETPVGGSAVWSPYISPWGWQ